MPTIKVKIDLTTISNRNPIPQSARPLRDERTSMPKETTAPTLVEQIEALRRAFEIINNGCCVATRSDYEARLPALRAAAASLERYERALAVVDAATDYLGVIMATGEVAHEAEEDELVVALAALDTAGEQKEQADG